jgi:hypothetical protein
MATTVERQRLRMDLGFQPDDVASLSDAAIDAIFVEAGEYYTDPTVIAITTRVISLRRLLMQAANEVDYVANNSTEKASQRYDHLRKELERWEALQEAAEGLALAGGGVRSGKPVKNPPRIKEYPEGFLW